MLFIVPEQATAQATIEHSEAGLVPKRERHHYQTGHYRTERSGLSP